MRIGFIGLGVMGARMAEKMLHAGYEVMVYNRTREKMDSIVRQGADGASDIASLAKSSDVICTCLSMPEDVMEVYLGEKGILEKCKPQTICIDFTTVGMETSLEISAKALSKGITYLDAPVSGGPEGVEKGNLTIMVGGDKDRFQQVLPLFQAIGTNIQHVGPSGTGSVAKLMNQYLVAVHSLAASEVMVTGSALGIRAEQLYDILQSSYGDSRMLRRHMENHVLTRNFKPGGAVKYLLKDVKLANELFQKAGVPAKTGSSAEEALALAVDQGLAELDMAAVIQTLEKQTNIVVQSSK
jgi:3-hydroxyisobutyrate dehydrogenase